MATGSFWLRERCLRRSLFPVLLKCLTDQFYHVIELIGRGYAHLYVAIAMMANSTYIST
jgi:hypothetical protein